mmetsp:Transcript_8641/g.18436  ORF Transcript_8641/g.18436 Transcript_8641/m.18436 type:complete len:298 (+) Transcript_8641:2-895(+)
MAGPRGGSSGVRRSKRLSSAASARNTIVRDNVGVESGNVHGVGGVQRGNNDGDGVMETLLNVNLADYDTPAADSEVEQPVQKKRERTRKSRKQRHARSTNALLPTKFYNKDPVSMSAGLGKPLVLPSTREFFSVSSSLPPIDAMNVGDASLKRAAPVNDDYIERRKKRCSSAAGPRQKWWQLPAVDESNDDLMKDIAVLRNREHLSGKRFYKAMGGGVGGKKWKPTNVHVGTVVEGSHEFFSSRVQNRDRKERIAQELLDDCEFRAFAKRKMLEKQELSKRPAGRRVPKRKPSKIYK